MIGEDIGGHFSSIDIGILGFKTFHNLGSLCLLMENYAEAREWWLKAVEAASQFLPSAFALFDAALEAKDFATAQRMLQRVQAVEGKSANWAAMSARYTELGGCDQQAELFLRRAVAEDPISVGARLVLARRLLQSEREMEAQEHLHLLEQQGVAEAAYYLGVSSVRQGDLKTALAWMKRALALNPGHEGTQEQIANLQRALTERDGLLQGAV